MSDRYKNKKRAKRQLSAPDKLENHISKEKERRKRKNEEKERKRAEKGNGFTLSFYTAYVVAQKAA